MRLEAMILAFWMLTFKPDFSLSSFTFIKRLFSYSSLSAIRVASSVYLRLLILLEILIPACASSNLAFCMMNSGYKLNKQGDNIQPWRTPFPNWNQSKVKWALESITTKKASGGDGIPVELFQILEDDAVKVLHSIGQQIWKTRQWPQDWKKSIFIPIPKKGNAKEGSNYCTIAFISHASKIMLKILQARLQQLRELWTSRCSSWF